MTKRKRVAIAALFISILALPLFLYLLLLDGEPALRPETPAGAEEAKRARSLYLSIRKTARMKGRSSVTVTEDDVNGLLAFISRGLPGTAGRVTIGKERADIVLSRSLLGRYLNLRLGLLPSEHGLVVSRVSIGGLTLPGGRAMSLLRGGIDLVLGRDMGGLVLGSIKSVAIAGRTMTVRIDPPRDLMDRLDEAKGRLKKIRDELSPAGDPEIVRVYYRKILEIGLPPPKARPVSLAGIMSPVFSLARQRAEIGDASTENRAAILALATALGSDRFETLIGPVRPKGARIADAERTPVMLRGRKDLRLHFLVSAGLQIVSESGITHAVGELKELMDSGRGGSGFSFADLAADRAGVRFAEMATDGGSGAFSIQSVLSDGATEDLFFPDISGLPEGLSQSRFEKIFGSVEGMQYRTLLQEIDEGIGRLPAYGGPRTGARPEPLRLKITFVMPPEDDQPVKPMTRASGIGR